MIEITAAVTGARLAADMLGQIFRRPPPAPADGAAGNLANDEAGITSATGGEAAGTLRQIAARYDLTNISPAELSGMLQELHQAGLLDDKQYHELSMIRLDLDAAGIGADQSINLLDFYGDKLRETSESAGSAPDSAVASAVEPVQRRYDWLQKMALLQSAPGAAALDAVA